MERAVISQRTKAALLRPGTAASGDLPVHIKREGAQVRTAKVRKYPPLTRFDSQ